jgi:hypothetical protein
VRIGVGVEEVGVAVGVEVGSRVGLAVAVGVGRGAAAEQPARITDSRLKVQRRGAGKVR